MLGRCCNKTCGAMTNYDDRDDDGDKTETKTETPTTMPLSYHDPMVQYLILSRQLGISEEDQVMTRMALWMRRTMYLRVGLYIYSINTILKMCHKLLYEKIGVLDLCC